MMLDGTKKIWEKATPFIQRSQPWWKKAGDFISKWIKSRMGFGYYGAGRRRRGRFVKGSPQAYAYMAMLRARRGLGARRRSGCGYRAMGLLNFSYPGTLITVLRV